MFSILKDGGVSIWFLFFLIGVIIFVIAKAMYELYAQKSTDSRLQFTLNSILFWGAIAAGVSIFGFFNGMYVAFQNIAVESDLSPAIVSKGALISLYNMVFGLLALLVALIFWFFLKWRYKKLVEQEQ